MDTSLRDEKPSLADLEFYILCGGQGQRLRAVVSDRPKPMADVAGRPLLAWILDLLARDGARRFTLCAGYRADAIVDLAASWSGPGEIRLSIEDEPLGTGGALLRALDGGAGETAFAMNGDTLAVMDVRAMYAAHLGSGAPLSIALARADAVDARDCGRVKIDPDGRVICFDEPSSGAPGRFVSAGVYCFETAALCALGRAGASSLERDLLPRLAGAAHGHVGVERFLDIGTPERYAQAEAWLAAHTGALRSADRDPQVRVVR